MRNGRTKINREKYFGDLKFDYLLNMNSNHSNYYRLTKYKPRILNSFENRTNISNFNFNIPLSYSNFRINNGISSYDSYMNHDIKKTSDILNNLRNTIKKAEKILNRQNTNVSKEMYIPSKLSKSIGLQINKNNNKEKRKNVISKSIPIKSKNKIFINNEEEILKKLMNERSKLMKKNIDIRKKNMVLGIEINNYKKQIKSGQNLNTSLKNYYSLINKNFGKYKTSLESSINENTIKLDKLFKLSEINEKLQNQIKTEAQAYKPLFKKIEFYNHENAKIQLINQENEKKLKYLQKEQDELIKKREKLNLYLSDLKNTGKNYNMIYHSISSKTKDTEDLITKLNNNKILLEEKLDEITEKINNNTNIINKDKRKLILYNNKLKVLKDEIYKLDTDKRMLKLKNEQTKRGLINSDNNLNSINNNNYLISIGLQNELKKVKYFNNEKMKELKKKENEVENLKKNINDMNYIASFNFRNNLGFNNSQILENEIQSIIIENENLTSNISNLIDYYDSQLKLKDINIKNLENLLTKNQKKNDDSNNYIYNTMFENRNEGPIKNDSYMKYDDTNIIYNRLNNINEPENNQNNKNNSNSKKEENVKNNISEFISDEGKVTDLENIKINDIQNLNININNIINNKNDEQIKVVKKETDDLAEIVNQIEEYQQSNRQSGKKHSNFETSDSNNPINHSNQAQKNESTEPEFDLNKNKNNVQINNQNLDEIDAIENIDNNEQNNNEENQNDLNNENSEENMELIDNYDDEFYNDINNINDINNEYENYDENINYEQEQ